VRAELFKVVFPSRQETLQMTLVVMVMVMVSGLFLWGVDSIVLWVIRWLTGAQA